MYYLRLFARRPSQELQYQDSDYEMADGVYSPAGDTSVERDDEKTEEEHIPQNCIIHGMKRDLAVTQFKPLGPTMFIFSVFQRISLSYKILFEYSLFFNPGSTILIDPHNTKFSHWDQAVFTHPLYHGSAHVSLRSTPDGDGLDSMTRMDFHFLEFRSMPGHRKNLRSNRIEGQYCQTGEEGKV